MPALLGARTPRRWEVRHHVPAPRGV
jgi:hypothetical protein